jgi:putative DNA primase/helicase
MSGDNRPFHERVVEQLIEQLREGVAPWQRPWNPAAPGRLPMNPTTGNRYRGINAIHLMAQQRDDPRWLTYRQAQAAGAQVSKGERGTAIQFWKFTERRQARDANGVVQRDEEGRAKTIEVKLARPRVFTAVVFNAEQVTGLASAAPAERNWEPLERAEEVLRVSGARMDHAERNRAFYRPSTDTIYLPQQHQFSSRSAYYATALHELGHWTGHSSRLDRDLAHPFGSRDYAREELRAEIASLILGHEIGVGHDPKAHAAYVASWIDVLKDDPLELFRAAADAEKINTYVLARTQEHQRTEGVEPAHSTVLLEQQFEHAGLRCLVQEVGNSSRSWLVGYVDLQAGHPLHGFEVTSDSRGLRTKHGLSFTALQPDGAWRIGFDLAGRPRSADAVESTAESVRGLADQLAAVARERLAELNGSNAEPETVFNVERSQSRGESPAPARHYLAVPYAERAQAKALGAAWDPQAKCWYARPGVDVSKLARWEPSASSDHAPPLSAREEFASVLLRLGFVVDGEHPIMDGKPHRIRADGDKSREKAGFYVGHLDGFPAGYAKNNRTGSETTWRATGHSCTPEERAEARARAITQQQERERERHLMHEKTALKLSERAASLVLIPYDRPTPYLQAKGVTPTLGVLTDRLGATTYVPAYDVKGRLWSMQYIQADGTKRFAKNSRKEGCFHPVGGGVDLVARAGVVVIAEGYATAASLSDVVRAHSPSVACVAAFDSGNLLPVAKALRERFPNTPIVLAADDDKRLEHGKGVNPGQTKAHEAAREVRATTVVSPVFAPGEADAGLTDFNDLATRSALGREAVERQVQVAVGAAIASSRTQSTERIRRESTRARARVLSRNG